MKNTNSCAYAGKILRINLFDNRITTEPTSKYTKDWIGSSGIAIKILYDEVKSWVTPFDPANKIIFSSGTLIGTNAPGANKMNISTLGPVTGGWATGSSDSHIGGQLKFAGYDVLIIEGKARKPVYIWIYDDQVEIRNAEHIWGKTTWETLDILRKENSDPDLHTISIGPAGENLVKGACVIQDKFRAFGRCGTGAVIGSKNLKAITVKGTGVVNVAKPKEFMNLVGKIRKAMKKGNTYNKLQEYGTLYSFPTKQELCQIQYKNFQECTLPENLMESIDPRKVIEKYQVSKQGYPGCAIGGCGRNLFISKGPYTGLQASCPQWEMFGTLQARLAIEEPTFMIKATALCNQLGLDVDMAGGSIGWAMECYQRKIIDKYDADGLELEWGDAGVALELIRKIAYRDGFGNLLAEGCAKAADILGRNSSYYAINIKGQDLYETYRGSLGRALGTITSTRGGGHTTGTPSSKSWTDSDLKKAKKIYGLSHSNNPLEYKEKEKIVMYTEVLHRINNCLGICHINTVWWDVEYMELQDLADLYSLATGWETTVNDLKKIAMRQLNLEKAFNLIHTNFDRKDDMPTPRQLNEPIPKGKLKGWKFDKKKLNKMLDKYYEIHGWDKETSFPTRKTLLELGLENVAEDLEKIGKLK